MKLFVLRHGEAEPISSSDRQRELTERGRIQVKTVVQRNKEQLSAVESIFVSPFVRTQQTAGTFMRELSDLTGKQFQFQTEDCLTPNSSPAEVLEFLCQQKANSNIVLISHQPLVSELISDLCDVDINTISMPTAALASIDLDPVGQGFGHLNFID